MNEKIAALVVEENKNDIQALTLLVNQWSFDNDTLVIMDCVSSISNFEISFDYDIILLDIELPEESGIDLAKKIRAINDNIIIAFITDHREFALAGYDVYAMGYFVKPIRYEQVCRIFDLVRRRLNYCGEKIITFKKQRRDFFYKLSDINYVEVRGHNCMIRTTAGTESFRITIGEAENILPSPPFARCHRSYIVNTNNIKQFDKRNILLMNGDLIAVGSEYLETLKKVLIAVNREV